MNKPNWRPSAALEDLRLRAQVLRDTRAFFEQRGVLEVETPILSQAAVTDPHLKLFSSDSNGPRLYLQTSPEYPMKRLLAAGSGAIYQICKCFRAGEQGRRHNPEFSMLEWYRPGFKLAELQQEVTDLIYQILGLPGQQPVLRLSYAQAMQRHTGIDPLDCNLAQLQAAAAGLVDIQGLELSKQGWLDLLWSHCVEPQLGQESLCYIEDYPVDQAALARLYQNPKGQWLAQRFEAYYQGIELANAYAELGDAEEQQQRFTAEQQQRLAQGLEPAPYDEHLIAALDQGLPECSGVALGLDRLIMLKAGADRISSVISFDVSRC